MFYGMRHTIGSSQGLHLSFWRRNKPLRCLVFIGPHLYHILMIPKYLTFSYWPSLLYLYGILSPFFWYQIYVGLPQEKVKVSFRSMILSRRDFSSKMGTKHILLTTDHKKYQLQQKRTDTIFQYTWVKAAFPLCPDFCRA